MEREAFGKLCKVLLEHMVLVNPTTYVEFTCIPQSHYFRECTGLSGGVVGRVERA